MAKLTKSPRLNYLLSQMGIFEPIDVVNHLPRRYDDYSLTKERDLLDKDRVVIYCKVVSQVLLSNSFKRISIISFDVLTDKGTYFKVIAYNRPYLAKIIKLNEKYTIIGSYDKKEEHN